MLFRLNASLLIFIILFQGLLFNILHYWLAIGQAHFLVQIFILLEVIFLFFWGVLNLNVRNLRYLASLTAIYLLYLITSVLINPGTLDLQSVRTIFVYVFPFSMFYLGQYYRINELMSFYFIIFSIVVLISFLQMFFSSLLPDFLLYVPSLINPERIDQFFLNDSVLNRPNGLIGNPIEFGVFMNLNIIALLWWISESSTSNKGPLKFILGLSIVLVFLSVSRFAIALVLFNLAVYVLFFVKNNTTTLSSLIALSLTITLLVIFKEELVFVDAVIAKFDGRDPWANQSNVEHISDYFAVYELVSQDFKNILFGLGSGYNNKFDIITDGFHFILLVDTGIIGVCMFYILSTLFLAHNFSRNRYKGAIVLLAILFFASGFVNSGYLNKTVAFLFWFIAGVTTSQDINIKTKKGGTVSH